MGNFKNIGLFVKKISTDLVEEQSSLGIQPILNKIKTILQQQNCNVYIEKINKKIQLDLIIVIGGDGSLLKTAKLMIDTNVPILGIHKGYLGFLADVNINKIKSSLLAILNGEYIEEQRILIQADIIRINKDRKNNKSTTKKIISDCAINDIVLYNGKIPKLIEFEIFIDKQLVLHQRSDGIIISTPTGSTAYSLSAGGPILYPTLKNFSIIPMYPHTLSSRPLIINANSIIQLKILNHYNNIDCGLSFDGQNHIKLKQGDQINISKYKNELKLIHPIGYNYFSVLREKLGWK